MEFIIKRTSTCKKPCKEAIYRDAIYIDRRTVKTLEEAKLPKNKHWSDQFFASGTNHREELGMIVRDLNEQGIYVIYIDTLEELFAFIDKYGRIILSEEDSYKGYKYSLEIYDDYRE